MMRSFVLLFAVALTGTLAAAVFEAESGTPAPNGAKVMDYDGASGGKIVRLLGKPALKRDAVKPETPDLVVPFTVEQDDAYGITAYVCTEHTGNDSVYFRVDDGKMLEKHFGYPKKCVPFELGTFELNAGAHKLAFYHRESNFGIDRIEVKPVKRVPRTFTVKGLTGTVQTYTVRAPAPGNYILRVFCHREKAGPQQDARVTIGDNMPIVRRIIFPTITKGSYEIERIPFRGKPVSIKLEIAPEVIIDQLVFQPVRKRLPREAEVYVPKIVPRPDRPRLLVNNDLLPIVKDRLKRGQNALAWEEVRTRALRPYKFVVPKDREVMWDERLIQAMRAKALYYLITGDKKVGREACELAVAYFKVVNFGNGQDICRRTGAAILAASMVYDWCYPVMTDAERAILRDRFLWQAESMEIGWPPFNQHINTGHGNEWQLNKDLLSMAIAVYDEDPVPWKYCAYRLVEEARPMKSYLYKSGYHQEGSAYSTVRHGSDLCAALLLKRACGFDQYEPYVGKVIHAWFHLRTPDGKVLADGDDYALTAYPGFGQIYLWSNALWPDNKNWDEYFRYFTGPRKYADPVSWILLADPDQKTDPRRDDLPKARYFGEPVSMLLARTGWHMGIASEDTVVEMTGAGLFNANHQHFDAGAFQLYYRGLLTCDIGQYRYYSKPYARNFAKTTMSHSCVRLIDPEQKKTRMGLDITSGVQEYGPHGYSTLSQVLNEREKFSRGEVLSVSTDPKAPYLQVDLTKSYPNRAKKYVRTMVFLAAEKPALAVFDEIELPRPAITPVWQITTYARPQDKGGKLVAESNLCGLPARLTISTILPKKANKKVLTGRDAHTVEGVFYPPPFPERPEATASRTEITAEPGKTAVRFLHVLQPTPGTEPAPVEVTEKNGVITLASEGWTLEFAPGKAPKATVTRPADPPAPPREAVYLDGKLIGKLENGAVRLTALIAAKKIAFTDRDGKLVFDGITLRDGQKGVSRADGAWLVPADAAAGFVNADMTLDRWTGSVFLQSRPGKALTLMTSVSRGSGGVWRQLLENGIGDFQVNGPVVCTAVFREARAMDGVRIRFRQGDVRRARFKIEISADGETFKPVFDGESSGRDAGFEKFAFPAQPVRAIQFTFSGNTVNAWNNISGLAFNFTEGGKK